MSDRRDRIDPADAPDDERPRSIPTELPVLPLRDTVLFPSSFMPLAVARPASVRLIDEAVAGDSTIAVVTQRDAGVEAPGLGDLYPIGTATHIHKMFTLPDGSLRLIVQGLSRVRLVAILATEPYLRAAVREAPETLHPVDEAALAHVIRGYTREAGVRNLERTIGAICRKVARRWAEGDTRRVRVDTAMVGDLLGAPEFLDEEVAARTTRPGVAVGLAWTPAGGEVLFVEASRMRGAGSLTLLTIHLVSTIDEVVELAVPAAHRQRPAEAWPELV